jgi:hypothetical protein
MAQISFNSLRRLNLPIRFSGWIGALALHCLLLIYVWFLSGAKNTDLIHQEPKVTIISVRLNSPSIPFNATKSEIRPVIDSPAKSAVNSKSSSRSPESVVLPEIIQSLGEKSPVSSDLLGDKSAAPNVVIERENARVPEDLSATLTISKTAIATAVGQQKNLERQQTAIGLNIGLQETTLATQMRKSAKPDCLKPTNSDSTNNISNAGVLIGQIIADKCNW